MPKKFFQKYKIPLNKPFSCSVCPLCGIRPKEELNYGSKYNLICVADRETIISGRGSKRPLKRHCEKKWEVWNGEILLPIFAVKKYKLLITKDGQYNIEFSF